MHSSKITQEGITGRRYTTGTEEVFEIEGGSKEAKTVHSRMSERGYGSSKDVNELISAREKLRDLQNASYTERRRASQSQQS